MASQKSHELDTPQPSSDEAHPSSPEQQQAGTKSDIGGTTTSLDNGQQSEQPQVPNNSRLQAILAKKARAEAILAELQAQRSALVSQTKLPSDVVEPDSSIERSEDERTKAALKAANATIKQHIALLTKYNDIKDIAQGLMGLIAEQRGVRMSVVMEEFGMGEKD